MFPKIKSLTIEVTARGSLTNAAARDETGQLRGDVTSGRQEDIQAFVDECKTAAEEVTVTTKTTPPSKINGTPVHAIPGTEVEFNRQTWVTLIPSEGEDDRIWEFSLNTGKVLRTR